MTPNKITEAKVVGACSLMRLVALQFSTCRAEFTATSLSSDIEMAQ